MTGHKQQALHQEEGEVKVFIVGADSRDKDSHVLHGSVSLFILFSVFIFISPCTLYASVIMQIFPNGIHEDILFSSILFYSVYQPVSEPLQERDKSTLYCD